MQLKELIKTIFKNIEPGKKILFRVDAGRIKGLSYGHLMRCRLLAKTIEKDYQCSTTFFMKEDKTGIRQAEKMGLKVIKNDASKKITDICHEYDAIVFDLPKGPDLKDLKIIRSIGKYTVIIDDNGNKIPWADVILNSSIIAKPISYPIDTTLLLGPDYFIFPEPLNKTKYENRTNKTIRILITFGGSDPTDLTIKTLTAIYKMKWLNTDFRVVLGPGFSEEIRVKKLVKASKCNINIVSNPPELVPLILESDLVICAGGRTLYETCFLKIPVIAIASIEHEIPVVTAFLKRGDILSGLKSWNSDLFIDSLKKAVFQKQGERWRM